jgi:hypothetical protein
MGEIGYQHVTQKEGSKQENAHKFRRRSFGKTEIDGEA